MKRHRYRDATLLSIPVGESSKQSRRLRYGITSPYILDVGNIEKRRNLLLLVKTLKNLKVIYLLLLSENKLSDRVHLLSNIPSHGLRAFYQMASLFVYPSFFEGFGIPILEAQLSGIPVIAATGSYLEEAVGPGALYTDPTNEHELRELIEAVLNEPNLAASMRKGGLEYTQNFDAKKLATDMMDLYRKII